MTGGEISPRLDGRPDVAKQRNGLRVCENFQILVHGGARKRSGTRFVCELKSSSDDVVLVPFQYSTSQAYMLVFGPSYVWIMKDRGVLTDTAVNISAVTKANPGVVTTSTSHGLSNGDRVIVSGAGGMTELNNRQFVVANKTSNTFQLSGVDTSAYTTFTSGGTVAKIIEVTTTYTSDELQELRFAQYNDVLYITHGSHPLKKLSRVSATSWTLSEVSLTTGPFRTINDDDTHRMTVGSFSNGATAYGTHQKGETFTLTSSQSYFTADMVGALFRLNEDGGGTGVPGAPVGNSNVNLADGYVYTYDGKVYGTSDGTSYSGGTWLGINRVPNHEKGYVTVIHSKNSATTFRANFLHPTYCIVQITAYSSATSVTAQIVRYQMPKSIVDGGTAFWEEGAWSAERGYPKTCAFFEQRLFCAGTDGDPTVIWSSKSGAFEDFSDGPDDDDALIYRATSGQADIIRWMVGGRVLTCGTSQGEYAVAASNQNEALTPTNLRVLLQTTYGTSDCPPVRVNDAVLYPQRDGEPANPARKVREFTYDFASDRFNSVDLTVFAEHVTGLGYNRMAYQMQPDPMIWTTRTDGQIAVCTYERNQEVVAWYRHVLGGDGDVQTIGVCAGDSGDDVWVVVERTVNASTVRYVEVFLPPFEQHIHSKEDAVLVDSSLTYSGSSTSTITGLWHLRGETVSILNNGSVETQTVSSTGSVSLNAATTKAHVGWGYTAKLVTQDLDAGAQAGAAQSRMKRVSQVYVRVLGSLGGKVGKKDAVTPDDLLYRNVDTLLGATPDLYSGLIETDVEIGHDREAIIQITHDEPLPFHVTAIVSELSTVG